MKTFALGTVVLDHDARASNDFASISLSVDLAETSPCTENLSVSNFDQIDLMLGAESLDEFDVLGLCASFYKDAKMSLTLVESFCAFAETTSQTIVD